MKTIETCVSPDLLELHELTNKTVIVVDIFRASSTMVTALSNGVNTILPVKDLDQCKAYKEKGWLIAGERNGKQAEGFDLGNSPLAYLNLQFAEENVAMTTTNGTRAISLARKQAAEVLIGSFLNLHATANYLQNSTNDVLVLCAGWKGKFNIEDSLYAGALSLALNWKHDCDATLAMESLYRQVGTNLSDFLQKASHAKRLQNHDLEKDINFCLGIDQYNSVVYLSDEGLKLKH
ncbi:MAG: 2-phosphosulfolactate phosphatase [Cytophagales bacterium]|uniref:2-phosphosulfolactate phosphatase n=1 Tax=Cyclobacterium marinum TaxID=104 RepID=UPI0011EFEAF4|nr:2-phosphosulfolactate phosphatase [Cyclobacterium marinum]MBI0399849.1 2-phosphosulfolactate phosphatase [Cyclobacterium marinum]MBR9776158.1 2-phosphosulfolactate phosphatase [Cytophagales bacterium]|tara:strand:+ start:42771 stop:43475 length:705 start_codon:yes stop_codon:yes gene_type:complete